MACLLSACSSYDSLYASDNKKNYLRSRNGQTPVVPKPLTTENISNFYELPQQTNQDARVSPAPPTV